jgi:serine protease Do
MNALKRFAIALMLACPPVALGEAATDDPRVTPVVLAYRKARPAVVNISTKKIIKARWGLFGRDIFDEAFPSPFVRRVPVVSLGSGVIIHPAGYIVTNAHVVRRAQEIAVTLADESSHAAKVISVDEKHDLAVLKIEAPADGELPHLPLGRSDDLMVGETVVAVGNPLGYANTVTTGIISATDRTLEFDKDVEYSGLIQIDAPINPGNSGGPLLNIKGELIGINTAIRADAQNIGFAIPVDALADELGRLLDFERINRVVFGVTVRQRHGKDGDELYIAAVRAGSPAHGKLRVGDRIVALDDKPVGQMPDFTCAMLAVRAGQTVRLACLRDGKTLSAAVTIRARPRPDGKALARKRLGVTLREVTPKLARDLQLPIDSGLLVVGIDAGGAADRIGVRLRDILFQVDRFYVKTLDQLGTTLEDVRSGQNVRVGILRGNIAAWVSMRAD